jgi:NDP-sugar pyrophosphorylase family protein
MLLAAGRGERMEPLSSVVPKPALEVLGRPLLASALENLLRTGCTEIVVNLHRHPRQVAAAARGVSQGKVSFSWEPELLGGAGGVAAARPLLGDGAVLVGNADTWGELDLTPIVAELEDDVAVLGLVQHPDPRRWTSVVLNGDGCVSEFLPPGATSRRECFLFTGFQILGHHVVAGLPEPPCEMGTVWKTLRRDGRLRGVVVRGTWHEAGTPASYRELVIGLLGGDTWVHSDAMVEKGAHIEWSAIGAGCRVAAGATLSGCVVTAGASVDGESTLTDCVLAGGVKMTRETISASLVVPDHRAPLR